MSISTTDADFVVKIIDVFLMILIMTSKYSRPNYPMVANKCLLEEKLCEEIAEKFYHTKTICSQSKNKGEFRTS
jgi:hypothetical protein